MRGFVTNIEKDTIANNHFRQVLYTSRHSQLVLMSLKPLKDIGEEAHDVDQFIRVEEGEGKVVINGKEHPVEDGTAIVIPAGATHNLVNLSSNKDLKLYTIYSPPHHRDKVVHKTKAEAMADDEHFDGITCE